MRIAIVEDNLPLSDGIAQAFRGEGHGVDQLDDGAAALDFLTREAVDLVILDVNLPGLSGLEVLKQLRRGQQKTAVLLLTARDSIEDKVVGLDLGADDYLAKPFDPAELKARARALLRRAEKSITDDVQVGALSINLSARTLSIDGRPMELPRREFALAEILISRQGQVLSKQQIMDHLFGTGADIDEGAVELYVHRLRKKIANSGCEIKTVRGLGYCFRELS